MKPKNIRRIFNLTVIPSGNMNTVTLVIPSTEAVAGKLFGRLVGVR